MAPPTALLTRAVTTAAVVVTALHGAIRVKPNPGLTPRGTLPAIGAVLRAHHTAGAVLAPSTAIMQAIMAVGFTAAAGVPKPRRAVSNRGVHRVARHTTLRGLTPPAVVGIAIIKASLTSAVEVTALIKIRCLHVQVLRRRS